MDYSLLAGQLLNVQANLLQVPAYQQLSKMVRGELFVLNYLATHETAIHPKELSKKMAVSTARITFLLHHMEEKGLIARSSDLSDNRQIFVRLTENGVNAIQKARAEVISRVSSLLEALGPEDAREYIRIQEKDSGQFPGKSLIFQGEPPDAHGFCGERTSPLQNPLLFGTIPTFSSVLFGISVLY